MTEIYIKIFMFLVAYFFLMRLTSGGNAFRSWREFAGYNIFMIAFILLLDLLTGGAMVGVITILR